jgi:phosphate-selective porin OprO/OprP
MRENSTNALTLIVAALLTSWGVTTDADEDHTVGPALERLWGYATLYENADNGVVQNFSLSGRLQFESAWFNAKEGNYNDMLWRRFRFGFKSVWFQDWVLQIEGDFDLNASDGEQFYNRLTDAYIGWYPSESYGFKILKQSAGFTLDGATSSKSLLTLQRNNVTNNLWFTSEYFSGLSLAGTRNDSWNYKLGIFSSDGSDELTHFEAAWFTLASLGYNFAKRLQLDNAIVRLDYVYNKEDELADTRDFSQVLTLVTKWEKGDWGFWSDLSGGRGYRQQSDVWGLSLMPFYDFTTLVQGVLRYTYVASNGDNGVRLGRYEDRIVEGKGNKYNEIYAGANLFFYGHKLKWQTGLQYTTMADSADDGGEYQGWGLTTGLRLSW